ncbi:MAG: hypothetical protein AAFU80_19620 [Pseudomonadota bacterium]
MIFAKAIAAALLITASPALVLAEATVEMPDGFDGRALVVLADGAMLATGYIDGRLGPRRPDLVTLVPISGGVVTQTAVSNSVATWPNTMAVTPDGRYAIVAEPFAQPAEAAETFEAIERGRLLSVIDLAAIGGPTLVQQIEMPDTPAGVDVHPDGHVVAVTLPFAGQIALLPLSGGRLGEPALFDLGVADLPNTFVPEFKWRPDGRFAAVTLGGAERVLFYRYQNGALSPWGPPMRTAPLPGMGRWTPDGRHFIVTTITATGDMAQLGYGQNASLFAVFRFDETAEPDTLPRRADDRQTTYESPGIQHARVAHVPGGMGYVESFALSPDGRFLAAANMAASWLPADHPGRTDFSELALFAIDANTGALSEIARRRLPGVILPQGITFDADASHLAITSFQHDDREGGSVAFFEIRREGDSVALAPAGKTIAMPRGVHDLSLLH